MSSCPLGHTSQLSPTHSLRVIALTALDLEIPYGDVQVAGYCTIAILWVFDIVISVYIVLTAYHRRVKKQIGHYTDKSVLLSNGG